MAEAKITKRAYTRCPRSGEELGKEVKLKTGTGGTEYSKSVAFPYIIGNRRRSCRPVTLCHCPILEGPTAFRMWSATGFNPKTAMGRCCAGRSSEVTVTDRKSWGSRRPLSTFKRLWLSAVHGVRQVSARLNLQFPVIFDYMISM